MTLKVKFHSLSSATNMSLPYIFNLSLSESGIREVAWIQPQCLSGKAEQKQLPRKVGRAQLVQLKFFEGNVGWLAFATQQA